MNCSHARNTLFPTPEKAVATIETAGAMDHVRDCRDCQAFFARQRDLSKALRAKVGVEPAPDALRERMARLVEKHRASDTPLLKTRRQALVAAAAAVLTISLGGLWLASRAPSQGLFQEMCADHAKYLDAQSQLPSNDPAMIESWFRDKAEFRVHVPALEATDLLGSRLCFLKHHKAALIFYRKQGRPVSLFELSNTGVNLSSLNRTIIDGSPIWHESFNGYSLVAFENRGVVTVLVSDLQEGELLPLALAARRG
jgi:anti-sigma factor RsiW